MFVFENPSDLDTDWFLGHRNQSLGRISKKLLECISNFHILGIQFLFENFIKKRNGAILNQEEDMNMTLQVATFLNSVKDYINIEYPVIIVCPDHKICKWHYHMYKCGFESLIISSEVFGSHEVYIIPLKSVKLINQLTKLDLFCVVVDELDLFATNLIVRRLKGSFNIGLTKRNFYKNPDQKLRWTMLNWASPGCVGKKADFYRIDRLHFLAFADNYRFWWMRLTWNFCESFERPNDEELQDYNQKLKTWGAIHEINSDVKLKRKFLRVKEDTKVKKKHKIIENNVLSNNSLITQSYNNSNPDPSKITEDKNEAASTPSIPSKDTFHGHENEPQGIQLNEESKINDMFSESTNTIEENTSKYEDPIISIINSQSQQKTENLSYMYEMKNVSESSESDSEFLSSLIKNKNTSIEKSQSQNISEILRNLTTEEENTVVSDNEFFNELISGKKKQP